MYQKAELNVNASRNTKRSSGALTVSMAAGAPARPREARSSAR